MPVSFRTLLVDRLNADEQDVQARGVAEVEELLVAGDVEGRLGREIEGLRLGGVPPGDGRQHLAGESAVHREIVVHQEDVAEAGLVERVELGDDLRQVLMPLLAALVLDDIAEFARERASARGLQGAGHGALDRIQVPARDRRAADVGLAAVIARLEGSGLQICEDLRRDLLDLAGDEHVRMRGHIVDVEGRVRPADDHGLAARAVVSGKLDHPVPLRGLAGDADEALRRVQVGGVDQLVGQSHLPVIRDHRRDRGDGEIGHAGPAAGAVAEGLGGVEAGDRGRGVDQIDRRHGGSGGRATPAVKTNRPAPSAFLRLRGDQASNRRRPRTGCEPGRWTAGSPGTRRTGRWGASCSGAGSLGSRRACLSRRPCRSRSGAPPWRSRSCSPSWRAGAAGAPTPSA